MNPIPILGLGMQSKSPNVTAMTLVNMYIEIYPDQDKTRVAAFGMPGSVVFSSLSTKTRGMHVVGNHLYVVQGSAFYQVNNAGVATPKGGLRSSSGRVSMADNGAQICVVDGTAEGYIYTLESGAFERISINDPDFPGGNTVAFNDGYFIVNKPGTARFYISGLYDGFSWDALKFASAESGPDKLMAVWADHGELILFGENTTEFWVNSAAVDFPYTRISVPAQWGLGARWSVARFDNSLMWLARNPAGEVQVVWLSGYRPQRMSTHDIERKINSYENISAASAFSYVLDGHPFYQINFDEASWIYDGSTQKWSELRSATGRHRSEVAVDYLGKTITADFANGNLYRVDANAYTDNGETIVAEITGKHVLSGLEPFSIGELHLDMETGVGTASGQGSNPRVMLQISKDNGKTWGFERMGNMGAAGEYKTRARWSRLGQARNFTFKFRISDPVKRVVTGAWIT